jgi:nucleoside-diphosphate-sugar epimerase
VPERPAPADEPELEERLARPTAGVLQTLRALAGDVLVLGAGGKMGPSLARMARRALDAIGAPRDGQHARRVYAVARFSETGLAEALDADGVVPIRADATDRRALERLPDASLVLYLVGQKFGTANDPVGTWAQNVVASVHAAERYANARLVAFSTGNVYPRSPVQDGGVSESHPLVPDGEYAASCIGRERIFERAARAGVRVLRFRLCYACDLRYGVVTDVATRVLAGEPVPLAMGHANVMWQRDANALALRALALASTDAPALNVSGPIVSIRAMAEQLATHLDVPLTVHGTEAEDALLVNTDALQAALPPDEGDDAPLPLDTLLAWSAAWLRQGGRLLGKPTRFDVRGGRY